VNVDPPLPREALHDGPPVTPRQSASVILLRDGSDELELLLLKRSPAQRFMGGIWVFPGGAVDAHEGEGDEANRAAAVRELREESGVDGIDPAQLVKFSRWITPEHIRMRFDTHFFLAVAPPGVEARCDGVETVDLRWMSPRAALEAYRDGEIELVFPTIKHLEALEVFSGVDELLEHARGLDVRPVLPRVLLSGGDARVVLPGESGYDDA
jgi:8-oxo-dGTP pyrophosphatase MutT (NUDIX family)